MLTLRMEKNKKILFTEDCIIFSMLHFIVETFQNINISWVERKFTNYKLLINQQTLTTHKNNGITWPSLKIWRYEKCTQIDDSYPLLSSHICMSWATPSKNGVEYQVKPSQGFYILHTLKFPRIIEFVSPPWSIQNLWPKWNGVMSMESPTRKRTSTHLTMPNILAPR